MANRQRGCGYGRVCSVAIYWVLLVSGRVSQNHYPRFRGAPSGFFKDCPQGRPSVDSGLAFFGVTRNWDCQRLSSGSRARNMLPSLARALPQRPFPTLSSHCPRRTTGFLRGNQSLLPNKDRDRLGGRSRPYRRIDRGGRSRLPRSLQVDQRREAEPVTTREPQPSRHARREPPPYPNCQRRSLRTRGGAKVYHSGLDVQ